MVEPPWVACKAIALADLPRLFDGGDRVLARRQPTAGPQPFALHLIGLPVVERPSNDFAPRPLEPLAPARERLGRNLLRVQLDALRQRGNEELPMLIGNGIAPAREICRRMLHRFYAAGQKVACAARGG